MPLLVKCLYRIWKGAVVFPAPLFWLQCYHTTYHQLCGLPVEREKNKRIKRSVSSTLLTQNRFRKTRKYPKKSSAAASPCRCRQRCIPMFMLSSTPQTRVDVVVVDTADPCRCRRCHRRRHSLVSMWLTNTCIELQNRPYENQLIIETCLLHK
jgi:hypothetical protein